MNGAPAALESVLESDVKAGSCSEYEMKLAHDPGDDRKCNVTELVVESSLQFASHRHTMEHEPSEALFILKDVIAPLHAFVPSLKIPRPLEGPLAHCSIPAPSTVTES